MIKQEDAIGVFDSGLGGISVLRELVNQMPNENYIYYGDSAYAPYGEKRKDQIRERCLWICEFLISQGVKAIVIACNTATSACVDELRTRYPNLSIIGMEPALKVAVNDKINQNVRVLATKFTLTADKFQNMATTYAGQHHIECVACPKLVSLVEQDQLMKQDVVMPILNTYIKGWETLDSIVLGCTHFVYFKQMIKDITQYKVKIIDGNDGTTKHVQSILQTKNLLNTQTCQGSIRIFNSSDDQQLLSLSNKLLKSKIGLV